MTSASSSLETSSKPQQFWNQPSSIPLFPTMTKFSFVALVLSSLIIINLQGISANVENVASDCDNEIELEASVSVFHLGSELPIDALPDYEELFLQAYNRMQTDNCSPKYIKDVKIDPNSFSVLPPTTSTPNSYRLQYNIQMGCWNGCRSGSVLFDPLNREPFNAQEFLETDEKQNKWLPHNYHAATQQPFNATTIDSIEESILPSDSPTESPSTSPSFIPSNTIISENEENVFRRRPAVPPEQQVDPPFGPPQNYRNVFDHTSGRKYPKGHRQLRQRKRIETVHDDRMEERLIAPQDTTNTDLELLHAKMNRKKQSKKEWLQGASVGTTRRSK